MEALRQLAVFVQELRLEDLPQDVRDAARYCVLDTLGSALGAAENEELAAIAREYAQWAGSAKITAARGSGAARSGPI